MAEQAPEQYDPFVTDVFGAYEGHGGKGLSDDELAQRAEALGRDACAAADVQWLDQAVHATGLRLSRGEDGRLGFERTFKFEYSYDGIDRHVGRMVLRGDQLISFTGPGAARISQIRPDVEDAEDV